MTNVETSLGVLMALDLPVKDPFRPAGVVDRVVISRHLRDVLSAVLVRKRHQIAELP